MILLSSFITFFKIGLFTFGGGYAMIPLIAQDTIKNGWISLETLTDFIGISESTPGPFAVNIATFIGYQVQNIPGSIFTTLGVVLPSFFIILIIARYFQTIRDNFYVESAFNGLRPATLGLIVSSIWLIARNNIFIETDLSFDIKWKSLIILGILILIKLAYKKIHPILLIGISAGLGILFYGLIP